MAKEFKSYEEKAMSDSLEDLESYREIEAALAMIRTTSVDAGVYLAIHKKVKAAAKAMYAEGFDDGYHRAQE